MEDLDLYRSAAAMIKQHEEDAAMQAAMKSDALLKKGDMAGAKVWREVVILHTTVFDVKEWLNMTEKVPLS
jgi:hypothetical protein